MANKIKNKQVKDAYFKLFESVSEILFRVDPVGIASGKENPNEYDAEAGEIIAKLGGCRSEQEALTVVYDTFCDMFDKKTAGPKAKYTKVAGEIWRVYRAFADGK